MTTTTAKLDKNGKAVRIMPDGTTQAFEKMPRRKKSYEEIEAAALSDPDAQPLSDEQLAGMKRPPLIRRARRKLGLSQQEFSERFRIPLGTLRDWEQGRCEPDRTAQAYISVITHAPEAVRQALKKEKAKTGKTAPV